MEHMDAYGSPSNFSGQGRALGSGKREREHEEQDRKPVIKREEGAADTQESREDREDSPAVEEDEVGFSLARDFQR